MCFGQSEVNQLQDTQSKTIFAASAKDFLKYYWKNSQKSSLLGVFAHAQKRRCTLICTILEIWKAFFSSLSALENLEIKLSVRYLCFSAVVLYVTYSMTRRGGFTFEQCRFFARIQFFVNIWSKCNWRPYRKYNTQNTWKFLWKPGQILEFCHFALVGTLVGTFEWTTWFLTIDSVKLKGKPLRILSTKLCGCHFRGLPKGSFWRSGVTCIWSGDRV